MLNFLKRTIAKIWAKNHVKNAQKFKDNAVEDQENLLFSLVKTAEKTLFGRIHHFKEIKRVEDFQRLVPIADYEDLKPFIEKIKHGDRRSQQSCTNNVEHNKMFHQLYFGFKSCRRISKF